MKSRVRFFSLALLVASDICFLLLADINGVLSLVLGGSREGEGAATRNLWIMLLQVLPAVQFIGCLLALLFQISITRCFRNGPAMVWYAAAVLSGVYITLTAIAVATGKTNIGSIFFLTAALAVYLGVFMVAANLFRNAITRVNRSRGKALLSPEKS